MDPAPRAGRALKARILVSLLLGGALLAAGAAGLKALAARRAESPRQPTLAEPPTVRTLRVRYGPFREPVACYGRAAALRRARVAAEVAGVVAWVHPTQLEAGAEVAGPGGPALLRLDDRDPRARARRAQAELAAAAAEAARLEGLVASWSERLEVARGEQAAAEREYERTARLVPATLAASELDRQQMQVALRRQQVLQMEAALAQDTQALAAARAREAARQEDLGLAEREVERTEVHAPFAGRVVARHVAAGDHVRVGDPLFDVLDLARVEVALALPASRAFEVRPGAGVVLRDPGSGVRLWAGPVARVAAEVDDATRTFRVWVEVAGTPGENPIPPGTHVAAEVEGLEHPAVAAIPRTAFLGDEVRVLVPGAAPDAPRRVATRRPRVRRLLPGEALVEAGIEEGEEVVLTNLEALPEGALARTARAEEARAPEAAGTPEPGR